MKKKWYNVRTTQSVLYEQEVLARGPEEACEEAEAQIAGGEAYPVEGDYDFDSEVTGSRPHSRAEDDDAYLGIDDHDPRGDAAYLV